MSRRSDSKKSQPRDDRNIGRKLVDEFDLAHEEDVAEHGFVEAKEVADLLRRAMHGEVEARPDRPGMTWNNTYVGWMYLRIDQCLIVIFNDADEVDYVEDVEWKDGRVGNYHCWRIYGDMQPFDLLTDTEFDHFDQWIRKVA